MTPFFPAIGQGRWRSAWSSRPLHDRLSLLISGVILVFLFFLAASWLYLTRLGIHEEIQAAKRVSQQWLQALVARSGGTSVAADELLAIVRDAGRIRAVAISVYSGATVAPRYVSPASQYKAGRDAPAWFALLLAPEISPAVLQKDDLRVVLAPDSSRAILDAWDDLLAFAGWALLLLLCLFFVIRFALRRALLPLGLLQFALQRTGEGNFAVRLPALGDPGLDKLAQAFNQMTDSLTAAVQRNGELESERKYMSLIEAALHVERRDLAREVHDELAQGVTAVRTLAAAITQRVGDDSSPVGMMAARIAAVADGIQDEVRGILLRLRELPVGDLQALVEASLASWRGCHGGLVIDLEVELVEKDFPAPVLLTAQRMVQEALTNVVRHSGADHVVISLKSLAGGLGISVSDNGSGRVCYSMPGPGSGLGLEGLRERVALLGGKFEFGRYSASGWRIGAWLPLPGRAGAA